MNAHRCTCVRVALRRGLATLVALALATPPLAGCALPDDLSQQAQDLVEQAQGLNPFASREPSVDASSLAQDETGLWYQALDERLHDAYAIVLRGIEGHEESLVLAGLTADEAHAVFEAVIYDHPELFWTSSYTYVEERSRIVLTPTSQLAEEELAQVQAQIEQVATEALSQLDESASTYDKLRFCYEWVIGACDYAASEHDQTIQGVLLDHQAVCAGYARTLQYLLHRLGVPCAYVAGAVPGQGTHAWNLVWVDGTPTYVDPTWGDPTYEGQDGAVLPGDDVVPDYLCLTSEELFRDHVAADPDPSVLPVCDARSYDWFVLGGTYLETFDEQALRALVAQAQGSGRTQLRIKLGSREAYDQALAFVSSQEVFSCFDPPMSHLTYENRDTLYVIGFAWEP